MYKTVCALPIALNLVKELAVDLLLGLCNALLGKGYSLCYNL